MARKSKGDSAKPARAKKADVRVVDEQGIEQVQGGLTFEDGIVLTTTLALIGSLVLVIMMSGRYTA